MSPTIESGDILFISKIPIIFNLLKNKDIVIAKSFTSHNELVCKRIYFDKNNEQKNS